MAHYALLSVHVAAGAVALVLGPVAIRAERRPPYRSRPGSIQCFGGACVVMAEGALTV